MVSAWHQNVMTGSTTTWLDFMTAVRDPAAVSVPDATAFWLRHDLLRVLDTWSSAVAPERIRVLTVPPPGAPAHTLLERFSEAAELPADLWGRGEVAVRNVSLGAAEVEVMRRLNEAVVPVLNQAQHRFVVEHGLRPRPHWRPWRWATAACTGATVAPSSSVRVGPPLQRRSWGVRPG